MSLRTPALAFKRQKNEAYYTPPHAVWSLQRFADEVGMFDRGHEIWEPAAGAGHIAQHFKRLDFQVLASDLHPARHQLMPVVKLDFFSSTGPSSRRVGLITNPPYGLRNEQALHFLDHALCLMQQDRVQIIALLLPFEFDAATSRGELVGDHVFFLRKVTVGRRIRWINLKQKENGPMGHHAWFIWASDADLLARGRGPGVTR